MYSVQWRIDYEVWKVSLKICTVYNEELTMRSEKWVYICTVYNEELTMRSKKWV